MESKDLTPEDEDLFETTPDTPTLVTDFVNAGIDYEPSSDSISKGELRLFSRPLLGANSLSLQLFDEYKGGMTVSDTGEYSVIDLNIVPSPESTDETNVIEHEYGDNYAISDAYARYRMRLVAIQEAITTLRVGTTIRYRVVHVGVRDKLDKSYGIELFLNHDDSVDAGFLVSGRYERRPATPEQQLIMAEMIDNLLKPGISGDSEPDPDLQ